jgi:hypothetical protein
MQAAIPLLEARIAELEALPVQTIGSRGDPKVLALQSAIDATLDRIFGAGTNENHRLREAKVLDAPQSVVLSHVGAGTPVREIRRSIEEKRQRAIALLAKEVALMKEQLGDETVAPADRAIRAYANLDLHPTSRARLATYIETATTRTPSKMPLRQ